MGIEEREHHKKLVEDDVEAHHHRKLAVDEPKLDPEEKADSRDDDGTPDVEAHHHRKL